MRYNTKASTEFSITIHLNTPVQKNRDGVYGLLAIIWFSEKSTARDNVEAQEYCAQVERLQSQLSDNLKF